MPLIDEMFLEIGHAGTKTVERNVRGGRGGGGSWRGRASEGRSFDVGSELEAGVLMMNAL